MSAELDNTHHWDERGEVAVCLACRVKGYVDESKAFSRCPGPPPSSPPSSSSKKVCWSTMESRYLLGHTHLCETAPHEGDHICAECGRRFGKR
jgi:hypothetical protein